MMNWQHSGFNIYCGQPVSPFDDESVERLSQYIVRAPLSQERMTYIPEYKSSDGTAKVIYDGKTTKRNETFTALDSGWSQAGPAARLCNLACTPCDTYTE